jgi:hypothetical protein
MIQARTYLHVFLTSLLLSLAWYYYSSTYFLVFLGRALQAGALLLLIRYAHQRWRGDSNKSCRPLRYYSFWNCLIFFGLLLIAESLSFIHFQFTLPQYAWRQSVQVFAYAVIVFCAWKVSRAHCLRFIQIPISLCSALLVYEIWLTTQLPSPNQTVQIEPVIASGFISYGGGNGRLINTHYGIPQRRYLTQLVPGEQTFRPEGQADLARRIDADFGTPIISPVDGTVISALDSLPDLPVGTIDDSHPPGNHLCIQIDPQRFLYLANFAQDSMTVAPGDTVEIGQKLGRIGKTGSFTESALVILLVNHPNVIDPSTRSLPFYFINQDGSLKFPKRNAQINQP